MASMAAFSRIALVSLALGVTAAGQIADLPRAFTGREAEIESYLKEAPVVRRENLEIGITKPTRAWLKPGGPVECFAWKPLHPGYRGPYYESYKSEIAAYELDKFLGLGMVPPTVERKVNGVLGAAIMWIDNVRMWKDLEKQKPPTREWNAQMVRMRMFDALIGNSDRNAGNILVDPGWVVYLIDHSRAFKPYNEPTIRLVQADRALWERMESLDRAMIKERFGKWLDDSMAKLLLARRDKMRASIEARIKEFGEERTFIRE